MWSPDTSQIITAEQKAEAALAASWDAMRAERDRLLTSCDWTQVSDAPVDQSAWAVYRQALRDLPANTTDPANVAWPNAPQGTGVAT